MAVKILHKRSAVQFKSATGAQLELGELGLNYHESGPYLQCKDAAGEIVQLGGVYVGAAAPGNELQGAWWLRDSDNTLFLFDGTSWVSIAGGGGGGGGTTTVIGGDGIEAVTAGDVVTVSVDLATNSHGLSIVGGKLQADIATETTLGTVKIGDGIDVDAAGEISVDLSGVDVNADLDYTPAVDKGTVTNTAGDDATLPLADGTNAGLFTAAEKQQLADLVAEDPKQQDLGYTPAVDKGTVTITDGTDATIPLADATNAGLFTAAEKAKLDGIEAGAEVNVNADLEYVPDANNAATITNTAGDDATVPIATDSVAGLFTGDEKQKLAGIEDGAAANQDLGYTADGNNAGTVTITDGTDATVPIVTDTVAGLMTGTQKQKLDGIEAGAQVNDGYSQAESDGRYLRIDAGAPDQTRVSGEATFAELTTHEAGVSVTGGDKDIIGKGLVSTSTRLSIQSNKAVDVNSTISSAYHSGNVGNGLNINSTFDFSSTLINGNIIGIQDVELLNATDNDTLSVFSSSASSTNSPSSSVGTCIGFTASSGTTYGSKLNIGFRGNLNSDGDKNFNFYASGTAPNYFAGATRIASQIQITGTADQAPVSPGTGTSDREGLFYYLTGPLSVSRDNNPVFQLARYQSAGAMAYFWQGFGAKQPDGTFPAAELAGAISTQGSTGNVGILITSQNSTGPVVAQNSDARVKTLTPFTGNAADVVSQLNPGVNGFIAHELQQYVADAVTGTQDATEAIGTLADYDGTVLESDVTEPEELEYTEEVETDGVATMGYSYPYLDTFRYTTCLSRRGPNQANPTAHQGTAGSTGAHRSPRSSAQPLSLLIDNPH